MSYFQDNRPVGGGWTSMPNHWFRDHRMSYKAKGLLAYIATHASGYQLTVKQMIAETKESRDAVYAALGELVALGYLTRSQGHADSGKFDDIVYGYGPAADEQQYARNWGNSDTFKAPGDKTAGQTASGFSGYGKTGYGKTGYGKPDTKKGNTKNDQREEPSTPQQPSAERPALSVVEAGRGEEILQQQQQTAALVLDTVIGAAPAARRPRGAARTDLIADLANELAAGWPADALTEALAGSFAGATSVAKVLAARLRNVGPPPPPRLPAGSLAGKPADDGSGDHLLAEGRLDTDTAKQLIAAALAKRKAS